MSPFTVRPANLENSDHELLVDFMDSQIPWLSTIGSGGQWGTQSVRKSRPNLSEKATDFVQRSQNDAGWGEEWCRAFIAEAASSSHESDTPPDDRENPQCTTPVAGLVLTAASPDYVRSVLPRQDAAHPFVYLTYLMTDRHAGRLAAKGAGAFLIAVAKEQVRRLGLDRLCLDCWSGNGRKLVTSVCTGFDTRVFCEADFCV
jgi:hypothetical protein